MHGVYKSFEEQVDAIQAQKFYGSSYLVVSDDTPNFLKEFGIQNLPIVCGGRHLADAMKDYSDDGHCHGIKRDIMVRLPELLSQPAFVYDSDASRTGRSDSIAMITDVIVPGGALLMSMHLCGHGYVFHEDMDANFLTGIYGKRADGVAAQLSRAYQDGRLLYVDVEKTKKLLKKIGCAVPAFLDAIPDRQKLRDSAAASRVADKAARDEYNRRYREGRMESVTHYSKGGYIRNGADKDIGVYVTGHPKAKRVVLR